MFRYLLIFCLVFFSWIFPVVAATGDTALSGSLVEEVLPECSSIYTLS